MGGLDEEEVLISFDGKVVSKDLHGTVIEQTIENA